MVTGKENHDQDAMRECAAINLRENFFRFWNCKAFVGQGRLTQMIVRVGSGVRYSLLLCKPIFWGVLGIKSEMS